MKTTIAKAAIVATTTFAIAVCGVAVAVILGGPNWVGQAQSIDGYSFTYTGGEQPTWTASNDLDASTVKSSPVLADVIPPALDQKLAGINQKATDLANRKQTLEGRITVARETSKVDEKALQARLDELRSEIEQIHEDAAAASAELLKINEEIAVVEKTIEARRGDVLRNQTTVKVVDADIHRVTQLRRQLADLIAQIDAELTTAAERETQLKQMLGVTD